MTLGAANGWLVVRPTNSQTRSLLTAAAAVLVTDSLTDADICPLTRPPLPEGNCRVRLPWRGLVTGGLVPGEGANVEYRRRRRPTVPEPAPCPRCQQTHTAFSLSRPGGIAVPWCTASIGLHSLRSYSILSFCLPAALSQSCWATPAT